MAVKIFRSVWFLSVLAVLFVLLYQYASWPLEVVIGQGEVNFISLSKDNFFYAAMALLAFVNVTVYMVRNFAKKSEEFQAWFYGFIAVINFFLVIALSFISLFNSNEDFRFGQIGFIIYGSLILVFSWIVGGLLYWAVRKRLQPS
ncbi:MAG: hypothetical protein EBU52_11535 [Cytophagia bacterium]|nr:hypothetical protein [Cytophagia bacterium]